VTKIFKAWAAFLAVAAILCAAIAATAGATDWQGKKLPNLPANFIVGYGSLINSPSRNDTAGKTIPAIPIRVLPSFGFIRSWNTRNPSARFTTLGLRKPNAGEAAMTINGVLYPVEGQDMAKYDQREGSKYIRMEVPPSQIEPVGWQRLPEGGKFWVYVPLLPVADGGTGRPGEGLPLAVAEFPLLQSYIDVVVEGGLEYGPEFAREILETTDGWSRFWLNDRELPHRPWVHDPQAAKVDELLAAAPNTAPTFATRLFPELYGEVLRSGPGK
jgi:hypothetical protein